jgi:hypothetical protein
VRKDTVNSENMFTRSAYSKGTSFIIGIPAEITRLLKIKNKMHFTVHLIDGMVIYKPIDTRINSKHIPKNIKEKQNENDSKEIATSSQHQKSINENKDDNPQGLLRIVEEPEEIINDADIDVTGVEEL